MPANHKLRSSIRTALPTLGVLAATSLHALSSEQALAFHVSASGTPPVESPAPDIIPLLCLGVEAIWVGIMVTVGILVWNEFRRPLQ